MADNHDRLNELMKRLEALMLQQDAFAKEINALHEELTALQKSDEESVRVSEEAKPAEVAPVPTTTPVEEERTWPEHVDLAPLMADVKDFKEGTTSSGTRFIRFVREYSGKAYTMLCAENGNWIVQDMAENLVAKGRFRNNGKTVIVTQGVRQGDVLSKESVIIAMAEASGLHIAVGEGRKEAMNERVAPKKEQPVRVVKTAQRGGLEKFIGENLIAVIAVVILLIGVVFGVKYSIDHNLISPLTRIMLSYLLGIGILGAGIRFRKKYELFSAILVSGSMAIMYVTTFVAYSLYGIIPQIGAFAVMVLFTVFTVIAAIMYNRQIIAHIALVASYAIPFLLSNNSGNAAALFTYMLIVNAGILVTAFLRHWKPLYYVAFGFTWLIFGIWTLEGYDMDRHFTIALLFGSLFFLEFYAMFLAYKLVKKEKFAAEDIVMIILNSTLFYGIGYALLDQHPVGQDRLGLFTVAVACVHFAVSVIMYITKLADKNLFYLSSGMVLAFLTLAIPVQLDGNWVTSLWAIEATVLFVIGRTQAVRTYEFMAYPVILFALVSMSNDWLEVHGHPLSEVPDLTPCGHITFFTSLLVIAALGGIWYVNSLEKFKAKIMEYTPELVRVFTVAMSTVFLLALYNLFRLELALYWDQQYQASYIESGLLQGEFSWPTGHFNDDLMSFKHLWQMLYTMVFLIILGWVDQLRFKGKALSIAVVSVSFFTILTFLTIGLYELSELREHYLNTDAEDLYPAGSFNLGMRYVSYVFLVGLLYTLGRYFSRERLPQALKVVFELFMHTTIIWVLCSELINILDLSGSNEQHKLGISILCGLYAFVLVGLGILRSKQYLRISAFVLFGLVLFKLFFYDIAHLTTIAKTIVFISLGLILLLISFLYNKYKDKITGDE